MTILCRNCGQPILKIANSWFHGTESGGRIEWTGSTYCELPDRKAEPGEPSTPPDLGPIEEVCRQLRERQNTWAGNTDAFLTYNESATLLEAALVRCRGERKET